MLVRILLLPFLILLLSNGGGPLSIKSEVDKALSKVGDEILFKITVIANQGVVPVMPEIGNEIAGLRIVEFGEEKPQQDDKEMIYQKWYKLASYMSVSYILPVIEVKYQDPASGSEKSAKTSEIFLEVESDGQNPDKEGKESEKGKGKEEDIRDIKNIEKIPFKLGWPHAIIGLILLSLLGGVGYYYWTRYIRKEKASLIPQIPPYELARMELLKIRDLQEFKPFYFALSSISRLYLEEQFHFQATDMTLEEIKHDLDICRIETLSKDRAQEEKQKLMELFEQCDLVKFTDFTPPLETSEHWQMALNLWSLRNQFQRDRSYKRLQKMSLSNGESVLDEICKSRIFSLTFNFHSSSVPGRVAAEYVF
jgi:hypothetical protein